VVRNEVDDLLDAVNQYVVAELERDSSQVDPETPVGKIRAALAVAVQRRKKEDRFFRNSYSGVLNWKLREFGFDDLGLKF
jgi:hypothetical protein